MHSIELAASELFRADRLSWIMAGLIVFVAAHVLAYSRRYLCGDQNQRQHARDVVLLGASALVMVFANNLFVLLAGWVASDLLLVRLMVHKPKWAAARNSGKLALRFFGIGFAALAAGFWLLADSFGTSSIHIITSSAGDVRPAALIGLALIGLAAMTQSAAWPCHRWLLSSLNAPTPVSALMHAGLVNGGGFILVRFAPLYASQPALLHGLFAVGLISAVLGTAWKLVQPDVKRMLACSTMGQMGFMLMQFGMGLFAPVVSHLCWHGLFKAYLFLSAGSALGERRRAASSDGNRPIRILVSCAAGALGAAAFAGVSGIGLSFADTGCVMTGLAFMASAQLSWGLLGSGRFGVHPSFAAWSGLGAGGLYGLSVRLIEAALPTLSGLRAQPLDAFYVAGFAMLFALWAVLNWASSARLESIAAWRRLYMVALNASQPHPETVTSCRTAYAY